MPFRGRPSLLPHNVCVRLGLLWHWCITAGQGLDYSKHCLCRLWAVVLRSFACYLLSQNMYLTQSIRVAMEAFYLSCCWAATLNSCPFKAESPCSLQGFLNKGWVQCIIDA